MDELAGGGLRADGVSGSGVQQRYLVPGVDRSEVPPDGFGAPLREVSPARRVACAAVQPDPTADVTRSRGAQHLAEMGATTRHPGKIHA